MKLNEHTALLSEKVLLVPYSTHHVPTYHEWMQSPDLQQATASEPLTKEQEYEMQRSWRTDGDKLTFIACHPLSVAEKEGESDGQVIVRGGHEDIDGPERMVGDVNLFINESEDDEGSESACIGEVEIMVARLDMQGKGVGTVILLAFLWYVFTHLGAIVGEYSQSLGGDKTKVMKYLRVKIDAGNERSIRLFEKVGFKKTSKKPNYFNELELRYEIPARRARGEMADLLGTDEPKIALYQLV